MTCENTQKEREEQSGDLLQLASDATQTQQSRYGVSCADERRHLSAKGLDLNDNTASFALLQLMSQPPSVAGLLWSSLFLLHLELWAESCGRITHMTDSAASYQAWDELWEKIHSCGLVTLQKTSLSGGIRDKVCSAS